MSVSSVAAAFVAGQQQTRAQIATAITRKNIQAQREFVNQIAELARELQAAAPAGTGKVVDRTI